MITPELQILIETCKIVLLGHSDEQLRKLLQKTTINWPKLQQMAAYHGLRTLLYVALKPLDKTLIPTFFADYLKSFSAAQSINNVLNTVEMERLLLMFEHNQVTALPYKGAILTKELYQNNQLREWGDIDIYVPKHHAKQALLLLMNEGYVFDFKDKTIENTASETWIDKVLSVYGWNEVSLTKITQNHAFQIDFHWHIHSKLYPYQLNESQLFDNTKRVILHSKTTIAPSLAHIFLMMLVHHGGRESWLRLKHLCDLALFLKNNDDEQFWNEIRHIAQQAKLSKTLRLGFFCLQTFFEYPLPQAVAGELKKDKFSELVQPMIDGWVQSKSFWYDLKTQIIYYRLMTKHQDEGFSRWNYWKEYLKFYAVPNPIEEPRLITFGEKRVILNFLSKLMTYLWRKGFKT
jgi:Uncharacterised nucleotidyltransferase